MKGKKKFHFASKPKQIKHPNAASFTGQSKSHPSVFQLTVQEAKRVQQCASINCEEFITASDANTFCVRSGKINKKNCAPKARKRRAERRSYLRVIFAVIYSREKIIIKERKVHNNHIKIKRKDQTLCRQTTRKKKRTTKRLAWSTTTTTIKRYEEGTGEGEEETPPRLWIIFFCLRIFEKKEPEKENPSSQEMCINGKPPERGENDLRAELLKPKRGRFLRALAERTQQQVLIYCGLSPLVLLDCILHISAENAIIA